MLEISLSCFNLQCCILHLQGKGVLPTHWLHGVDDTWSSLMSKNEQNLVEQLANEKKVELFPKSPSARTRTRPVAQDSPSPSVSGSPSLIRQSSRYKTWKDNFQNKNSPDSNLHESSRSLLVRTDSRNSTTQDQDVHLSLA